MTSDEERLRDSIESGIQRLTHELDDRLRALMDELWQAAVAQREQAVNEARAAVKAEATDAYASALAKVRQEADQMLEAEMAKLRADEEAWRSQLDQARRQLDELAVRREDEAAAAQARRSAEMFRRLLEAFRRLDETTSLSEVLESLGESLEAEASRTAVFLVNGPRAQAWRLSGFEGDVDPRHIGIDIDERTLVGAAASRAEPQSTRAGQLHAGAGFADVPSDRSALAVPILVGGRPVAVVYADEVDGPAGADWEARIELVARHASRCLEALTAARTVQASV